MLLSDPPLIVMCGLGSRTARWTGGLNTPADALTSFSHPTLVVRLSTSRSCHRVGYTNPHPTASSDVRFGTKRTFVCVAVMSAFGGKADIGWSGAAFAVRGEKRDTFDSAS
jgi:hypothetical protein